MDIINVGLYGGKGLFGGKEKPLEASVISCDKHQLCSYYQEGTCLKVRSFGGGGCKYGSVNNIRGFTSRAKKYGEFKNKWKDHEQYSKLSYPNPKLGLIDGVVVFPYSYVHIIKDENGGYIIEGPSYFTSSKSYIELDKFNSNLIYRICSYRPQALMGGEITDYKRKVVPLFLAHLKEIFPQQYEDFVMTYPQYRVEKMNYVGRTALLKTIRPSKVEYISSSYPELNNTWYWDGELLKYESGFVSSFSVIKDYEINEISVRPFEKATVKITSNEQVLESTVFVD